MKDAFWTAGSPKYAPYEFARRAIAAKIEDEKPKPPPKPPKPAASDLRKCKVCGDMTRHPCG